MEARALVKATAGVGLEGDRYASGGGYWRDERVSRDLTLIEDEVLEELSERHGLSLAPGQGGVT